MRTARNLLAQSPAIVISVLALVFAVGGGAGYAASTTAGSTATRQSAPTPAVWHKMKLHSGWTGDLKYTVIDNVVYLTGSASTKARFVGIMAYLPASLSPRGKFGQVDIPVTFGSAGDGLIQVIHGGGIAPVIVPGTPTGNDYSFVSLAGVSFPVGS